MVFKRFEIPGLSHYSYVIGSAGLAAVIDPKRDVDTYIRFAEETGLRIAYVLETHIHADYASGATALADITGAQLCLSGHDEGETFAYSFPHRELRDGDELELGDLTLRVIHTPGHTPEHISFLLLELSKSNEPISMFSGDFLFVGSVGRPDLLGDEAKRKLAEALYDSVSKLKHLPDGVEIYPAHGAGSLCGSGMSQREQSTLGYERATNPFLKEQPKQDFVEKLLDSVPELPDYYKRMKEINSRGPRLLDKIPGGSLFSIEEFLRKQHETEAVVVDLRRPEAFGGAHMPDSINIGSGPTLSTWAAWMLPYDKPIFLMGDAQTDLQQVRRSLIRVGLDCIAGALRDGIKTWIETGNSQGHIPQISVLELNRLLVSGQKILLLDVRSPGEWEGGHIDHAMHIPAAELPKSLETLPAGDTIYIMCGSGYRSSIAASIVAKSGRAKPINVVGGMTAWRAQHLPVMNDASDAESKHV